VKYVVDVGIAVKWSVPEPLHDLADRLLAADHELLAPDLLLVEFANVVWKKRRRGEIANVWIYTLALDDLPAICTLIPSDRLAARALELADELGHPVYDCLYLACAEAEHCPVVTADRRFLRAVAGTRHEPSVVALDALP